MNRDSDIGRFRKIVLPSPRLFARMKEERWPAEIELLCQELTGVLHHAEAIADDGLSVDDRRNQCAHSAE